MAYQSPDSYRRIIKRARDITHEAEIQMGRPDENGNHFAILFIEELQNCLVECGSSRAELETAIRSLGMDNSKAEIYINLHDEIVQCINDLNTFLLKLNK